MKVAVDFSPRNRESRGSRRGATIEKDIALRHASHRADSEIGAPEAIPPARSIGRESDLISAELLEVK